MIVVKIKGGLGNQMFEYAVARKLLLESQAKRIELELDAINSDPQREYGLKNFCLCDKVKVLNSGNENFIVKLQKEISALVTKHFLAGKPKMVASSREKMFDKFLSLLGIAQRKFHQDGVNSKILKIHRNIYLDGWFQNASDMESIRSILLCEFSLKKSIELQDNIIKIEHSMAESESVCVHIRRGDYVGNSKYDVCTDKYYLNAMRIMADKIGNPVFYIFSDDIEGIKSMKFEYPVIYDDVEHNNFESLYLMTKCKNFIISNSTFSWWSQFLSDNDNKIVIAPNRWNNEYSGSELYMRKWILIDP